jgi:anti-sigma-K factor RskA
VERAPVGQAPSELSRHVASCGRCQERLLARGSGATPRGQRKRRPPLWRTVVVATAAILLMVVAWIAARWLT